MDPYSSPYIAHYSIMVVSIRFAIFNPKPNRNQVIVVSLFFSIPSFLANPRQLTSFILVRWLTLVVLGGSGVLSTYV